LVDIGLSTANKQHEFYILIDFEFFEISNFGFINMHIYLRYQGGALAFLEIVSGKGLQINLQNVNLPDCIFLCDYAHAKYHNTILSANMHLKICANAQGWAEI
jgi:hypothetical protein